MTAPPEASPTRRWSALTAGRRVDLDDVRGMAIVFPFAALFVVLSLTSEPFLTRTNLLNVVDQQAHFLMIAAAGTLVLIAGGIDLSVGAVWLLGGMTAAKVTLASNPVLGILAGIGIGLAVGLVNGIIVTFFRINAFIATLATGFVVGGIASLVTGGQLITLFDKPSFGNFANAKFLGVNTSTWAMVLVVLATAILLGRTTLGRYMYAAGGNAEAARLAGVPVNSVRILTFVLSGGAAGLGGVIVASRILAAGQTAPGADIAFTVLAGVVIGGTSILGGEGAIWRSVVGVLFIALIGNGFNLLGYNPLYKQIVQGGLILVAVGVDAWSRAQRR
jgi:ribose transport system permease protein